jgi:hypothetical protein
MAEDMTARQMRQLAENVMRDLGQLRDETWMVVALSPADDTYPWAVIRPFLTTDATASHARIRLRYAYDAEGKVTAEGLWPEGTGDIHTYRANMDPSRTSWSMAKDIKRRVLDAGYLAKLPAKLALKAEAEKRAAHEELRLSQAAELFGVKPERGRVQVGDRLHGSGEVKVYCNDAKDSYTIDLNGVPADVALAMLAVLAARTGVRAKCCERYGAGHDPRDAVRGCLEHAHGPWDEPFGQLHVALYEKYLASGDWQGVTFEDWQKSL